MLITCPPNNKFPHFVFVGGGPTIGGADSKGLLIFFIDESPGDDTLRFQSHTNTEPEWISFGFEASVGIVSFLEKAERQNRHVRIAVLASNYEDDVLLADFDVSGFTTNYERLACSNRPTATVTPRSTTSFTPGGDPYNMMLQLINEARTREGLSKVVMDNNPAAQVHANNLLANCISSHWDIDGLLPGMRYSLGGGYQVNNENVSGSDYCKSEGLGYSPITSLSNEVQKAMDSWMNSSGHRETILKPYQKKVNIGLAWDRYNFVAVQQFETDFVEFTTLPQIRDSVLAMGGQVRNGANLEQGDHFRVIITYDPPPRKLTPGQISRAYGACLGRKVAHLSYKSAGEVNTTWWKECPSPHDYPPDSAAPTSALEAHQLWQEARLKWEGNKAEVNIISQKIKMSRFQLNDDSFTISADIGTVLDTYGSGVYQVYLWGMVDGKIELISEYAIFHGIPRPLGYGHL